MTNIKQSQKEEIGTRILSINRVVRVRAGGRQLRFQVVVVAGDKKGRVGMGTGKSADIPKAVEKATRKAKKNMVKIPIVEGTIPHEVKAKFGAARVLLKPRKRGGLVVGGMARVICELAGIKRISGKILGKTKNKLNNARATLKALQMLKPKNNQDK